MALVLLTGFGSFEAVDRNPSGALAVELDDGGETVAGVEVPVTFRGSASALDDALGLLTPAKPDLILCMGVHPGASFRLERQARAQLGVDRPDNDGETGTAVSGAMGGGDGELLTSFDLVALADVLRDAGADEVEISEDAGGYVCERIYRHALVRAGELGVPALFLHVPPLAAVPLDRQVPVVRSLVDALRAAVI